jgi:hypothetical protein
MSETPETDALIAALESASGQKADSPVDAEVIAFLRAKEIQARKLLAALRDVLPVAEETCERWPNDDCYLLPTARAKAALGEFSGGDK